MRYLINILLLTSAIVSSTLVYNQFQEMRAEQLKESRCLKTLISQGVERRDILTSQGACIVGKDIYYTHIAK